jgi:glutamate receptor, ionotropic, plant
VQRWPSWKSIARIKSLISFVDKKEEEVKNALKKKTNGSQQPSIAIGSMEEHPSLPR